VAVVAGFLGYFLLIRGLTFAGHALSSIGFAGAAGAVLLGIPPVYGLLVFTVGASLFISTVSHEVRTRDVAIGVIMTFTLGLGILFLSLYHGYAEQAYSILFGSIVGISRPDVLLSAVLALAILIALAVLGRPLLFSSFDPEVAEARGLPVRLLGVLYLVLVALAVSLAMQVVGMFLVFALLVGPPATAIRLVSRPGRVIGLAIGLGLIYTWTGILLAAASGWPVSFFIAVLSFGVYLPVRLLSGGLHPRHPAGVLGRFPGSDVGRTNENPALQPALPLEEDHRG
jgi:zinc/manganese transport system permease protein